MKTKPEGYLFRRLAPSSKNAKKQNPKPQTEAENSENSKLQNSLMDLTKTKLDECYVPHKKNKKYGCTSHQIM
jgi:hypothetical protein